MILSSLFSFFKARGMNHLDFYWKRVSSIFRHHIIGQCTVLYISLPPALCFKKLAHFLGHLQKMSIAISRSHQRHANRHASMSLKARDVDHRRMQRRPAHAKCRVAGELEPLWRLVNNAGRQNGRVSARDLVNLGAQGGDAVEGLELCAAVVAGLSVDVANQLRRELVLGDAVLGEEEGLAFGLQDDVVPARQLVKLARQIDFFDLCAVSTQNVHGSSNGMTSAFSRHWPNDSLAQSKARALDARKGTRLIILQPKRIGHEIQIINAAGENANRVQHQGRDLETFARHGVPRRLDGVDAVERARADGGPAGLGAEGHGRLEVADGGARARGRASGGAGRIVRVARRGRAGVGGGEFGRCCFA